jgi:hypothetical protein
MTRSKIAHLRAKMALGEGNLMTSFGQYVNEHHIDHIYLSMEAKVRYLIVYNAIKNYPILPENAEKLKAAALRLTGVPYAGSFILLQRAKQSHIRR